MMACRYKAERTRVLAPGRDYGMMSLGERTGSPLSLILLAAVGVGDRRAALVVLHNLLLLTDHLGQIE